MLFWSPKSHHWYNWLHSDNKNLRVQNPVDYVRYNKKFYIIFIQLRRQNSRQYYDERAPYITACNSIFTNREKKKTNKVLKYFKLWFTLYLVSIAGIIILIGCFQ